ncbi:ABC transporter ATP-binding protein, partial [Gulosibacter molinativorax]|uniref:ABC transporter ATP-binding protein n=1 Tax=Gulosibacter molinativorax TaxID=256821 RepID=UPI001B7F820D
VVVLQTFCGFLISVFPRNATGLTVRNLHSTPVRSSTFYSELPRHLLEIVFILTIAALTFVLFATSSAEAALSTLGVFAAASVRLLPMLNGLSGTMTMIRIGQPGLHLLAEEVERLDSVEEYQETPRTSERYRGDIEIDNVVFQFEDASEPVVNGVSMDIRDGEMVALVGSSGAGKSTVLDLLIGLFEPTRGEIRCGGRRIDDDPAAWNLSLAIVPQDVFLIDDSIRRNIAFGDRESEINDERMQVAIEAAQLGQLISELEDGLDTRVGERGVRLSGGQRQRLGIARALYREPSVLILDEATSALDNATEALIAETIETLKGKLTIIVVAHRLSTVKNADRIYFMKDGKVESEGTFGDLTTTNSDFAKLVELGKLPE